MKIRNTFAALGIAALLTAAVGLAQTKPDATKPAAPAKAGAAAAAKPAAKAAAPTTHVMTGTVDSISGTAPALTVVLKPSKATDKPVTLMLNASTTKTGDLAQGAKVTAHYHVDNGQNMATSISVAAAKPAVVAKAKAPAATTAPAKK